MTALEVNLQTPQCLEILRFAITLFCERSAKDYSLMAFEQESTKRQQQLIHLVQLSFFLSSIMHFSDAILVLWL